jgi:arsenite-transporting ATPase
MIQELTEYKIDTHNIIVNQLLKPTSECEMCTVRSKMQQKYLEQIHELYDDFHVVELPLMKQEIRTSEKIKEFSKMLIE